MPNNTVPTTVPSKPAGSSKRNKARSRCAHICCSPTASITKSSGSMMAAACGTGMASAMSGTASEPKPPRKPLLDRPIIKTAGTATA